ncbi:NADH-quinone oxidoreductase subunit C [Azotosporobacter soli]|uniref:hydrogenase large subunit n=1 Tax=Azotosporobacter soli TaxID=3055040 RepID=UPI0031FE5CFE
MAWNVDKNVWLLRSEDLVEQGFSLAAMFANDERQQRGAFAVYAVFAKAGEWEIMRTLCRPGDEKFPSMAVALPAAAWYEREIHDLFGLVPEGHPDLRPLVLHECFAQGHHPLRKDSASESGEKGEMLSYPMSSVSGPGVFQVPVGPIHAGIIEPGHFRFSQAGEEILQLDARLFYTHRGIEKGLEGQTIARAAFIVERICGACSVSHALSFAQAVEKLTATPVPPTARYLRIVAAELERIYNHVGDVGNLCAGVGLAVGVSLGSRLKEMLQRLNGRLCGNRFLRGWVVPGGVSFDLTLERQKDMEETLCAVAAEFEILATMLQEMESFTDRVEKTGILTRQAVADLCIVGVAARAAGVPVDERRDHPYSAYDEMDFTVALQESGDVAARLWVRVDEVRESLRLIQQATALLLPLERHLRNPLGKMKPFTTALGWSESARGSNLHWIMAGENETIYRYVVRSASYPNWPALSVAAPGNIIPDFPLINKSFELCYGCLDR